MGAPVRPAGPVLACAAVTPVKPALAAALAALALLAACQEPPRPASPTPAPAPPPEAQAAPVAGAAAPVAPGLLAGPNGAPAAAADPTAAPPPQATGNTGAAPAPADPAARLPAPVAAAPVPVLDAQALIQGASTALLPGELATVDPGATFRVRLRGAWQDARLSLLEPGDAMVAASGAREVATDTTVTLQPAAPLKPATHYRLRVDGATTRELQAADGTRRAPVEFPLLITGDPAPEPKSRTKKPRR